MYSINIDSTTMSPSQDVNGNWVHGNRWVYEENDLMFAVPRSHEALSFKPVSCFGYTPEQIEELETAKLRCSLLEGADNPDWEWIDQIESRATRGFPHSHWDLQDMERLPLCHTYTPIRWIEVEGRYWPEPLDHFMPDNPAAALAVEQIPSVYHISGYYIDRRGLAPRGPKRAKKFWHRSQTAKKALYEYLKKHPQHKNLFTVCKIDSLLDAKHVTEAMLQGAFCMVLEYTAQTEAPVFDSGDEVVDHSEFNELMEWDYEGSVHDQFFWQDRAAFNPAL
jgi:hypothetical protein